MVFGAFLGKKEICKMMLNHTAARLRMSSQKMNLAEKYGYIFIRLFGFPLDYTNRMRARTVLNYLSERRGKLLDIGCSYGVFAYELARKGYSVTGIDVNPESIELANNIKKFLDIKNIHFINMDFLDYKFPANEFDIVIMVEVLEHIKEDWRAIQEIYRILRKDGILIISIPYTKKVKEFGDSPIPACLDKNGKRVEMGVPGEFHFRSGYNFERLDSLLNLNGFTITHHTYTKAVKILPRSMILFPLSYIVGFVLSNLSKKYAKLTILAKKEI